MELLKKIIDSIDFKNHSIKKVNIGLYSSYVENDFNAGVSSTLYFSTLENNSGHKHFYIKNAGLLHTLKPYDLCNFIFSDNILEASVGMACINSFVNLPNEKMIELNASKLIMEKGKNKNVAVIGHFPFIERLRTQTKNLWVFDNNKKEETDLAPEKISDFLPQADVVAITATSLMNKTLTNILKYINDNAYKIMLGPSTPMTNIMFEYKINALCGSVVTDTNLAYNYISQAVPFKLLKGIQHLILRD